MSIRICRCCGKEFTPTQRHPNICDSCAWFGIEGFNYDAPTLRQNAPGSISERKVDKDGDPTKRPE